ncbi:hypothetical protein [Nocardia sp. CC201C]|uniref:hypothetical protein n=1 Tax=Nocardia sp. CC201C TaxID=3044575 RepID=UPI0024A8191F|nr:hypothetical protein [Nocardia sp. CC201C]
MNTSPVADYIQSTPIYRRYAKGITATVAAAINAVWLLTVLPFELVPERAAITAAILVQVLGGVIGVVSVPNSPTARQAREIDEYIGRHRKAD